MTGAYALGPEAGEWLQQATLAIRAKVPLEVLRDTIQPFPTFSEIYVAALKALHNQIGAVRRPAWRGSREASRVPGGTDPSDHRDCWSTMGAVMSKQDLKVAIITGRFSRHRRRTRRRVPAAGLVGRGDVPDNQAKWGPGDARR